MQFIANAVDKNAQWLNWLRLESYIFFRRIALLCATLTYLLYFFLLVQLAFFHRFNYLICTFFFVLRFV